MTTRSVGIIGCGWLGRALAVRLIEDGVHVIGTTMSDANAAALQAIGVEPRVLRFTPELIGDEAGLRDVDAIVVAIPPASRTDAVEQAKAIATMIGESRATEVVQISSTSVYPAAGSLVDESDANPGHRLMDVEDVYRGLSQTVTVLRCAGLFGGDRLILPSILASGRAIDEDAPVNMVCQSDVVRAIVRVLGEPVADTFNICADGHPTKGEFYREIARCAGLGLPEFRAGAGSYRIVENGRFKERFVFAYELPDPLTWGSRILAR